MRPTLRPGLTAGLEYRVPAERTVPHLLPESAEFAALPHVLATGYLVGLVEWCCMRALHGHLEAGQQTLGVHVDLSHEAPTLPGHTLTVDAELAAVEGRRLTFTVQVIDGGPIVCRGRHQRAVIDRARFEHTLSTLASGTVGTPENAAPRNLVAEQVVGNVAQVRTHGGFRAARVAVGEGGHDADVTAVVGRAPLGR